MDNHHEWWLPFNESPRDLQKRVRAFEDKSLVNDNPQRTLVVSHWYFINAATGAGLDNAEVVMSNF